MKFRWTRLQFLSVASMLGAFALTLAGGFVTQTGSGLGCPDWPMCHGQLIPDLSDRSTAIEWTHRTIAAIVGVLVLFTTWFAWRDRREERRIVFAATMSFVLVVLQAILGGATVVSDLDPYIVVAHLAFAAAFFAMAVATALLVFVLPPRAAGNRKA